MKYIVAVRALCEFTAKRGDLDLRFTPSPTSTEGMEGHAVIRARRGPGHKSEITLSGEHRNLIVRGRADGYAPHLNRLEEVKTFRGDLASLPEHHRALHWAQAKVYAHLMCLKLDKADIEVAIVYFNVVTRQETLVCEHHSAQALQHYFDEQCNHFADWAEQELIHRGQRNETLEALRFPHEAFRRGQRSLAETVYKAARQGRCLMAQAPTGIGKTIGTLFPLLKACPRENLDKVFFLTAKTSGRQLALDALEKIQGSPGTSGGFIRVLELTAKHKACEYPDRSCHGESCPLAQGFYDRLPAARQAAVNARTLNKANLRKVALEHQICPYWLSLDLARWCDVVVGDYNYYFDASALLHGLTTLNQWRAALLVDEAHNLLERARHMYTIQLDPDRLSAAQESAPVTLKKTLTLLAQRWREAAQDQTSTYQVYPDIPAKLNMALLQASGAISDYLNTDTMSLHETLQTLYFDVLQFLRLAEVFGPHSIFDITLQPTIPRYSRQGPSPRAGNTSARALLCIRNIIPAPFLGPRLAAAHTTTLFSATLSPWHFYRDTLGLPANTAWMDVESPFEPTQLKVQLVAKVSTRYHDRARSLAPIAALMAAEYRQQPGNYLSFFSSFDYMRQVQEEFAASYADIPVWRQERGMTESDKEQFLSQFTADSRGIGFAVLGGAFAEGIDLPGRRLIGAFISTLGLPQVNPVNEELRRCMERTFGGGCGYKYTYLYPGIQKVVQAAGRVIRTGQDQGVVYLIDDRFSRNDVVQLLPQWWRITAPHSL